MQTITRRTFLTTSAAVAALCLAGCSNSTQAASASSSAASSSKHVIGVAVYNGSSIAKYKDDGIIFQRKKKDERMSITP